MISAPVHFLMGDTIIISGQSASAYHIKFENNFTPDSYNNSGFSQKITRLSKSLYKVEVTSNYAELKSEVRYPVRYKNPTWFNEYLKAEKMIQSKHPEIRRLALKLAKGCSYQVDVVEKIVKWVSENIEYSLHEDEPRDALSVLRKKRGYCIGYSNLTVALLRALNIPARNVHGIFFNTRTNGTEEFHAVSMNGVSLHRWIEVMYLDKGWVFSDPRFSANHVSGHYIVLALQNAGAEFNPSYFHGTEVQQLSYHDSTEWLDRIYDHPARIFIRPNKFRQKNGIVSIYILNKSLNFDKIEVVVASLDRVNKSRPEADGSARFFGLKKGEYELKIRYEDKIKYITKFSLSEAQTRDFDIKLKMEESR